jgi:transaldolase
VPLNNLKVKLFADGADMSTIIELYRNPLIKGFTTNPTLMRKAGIQEYKGFALEVLSAVPDRPISFEVFADEFPEMHRQAREIASWGENVYVKIPITNTRGESSAELVSDLSKDGVKVNVTAMMTLEQVDQILAALTQVDSAPSYLSIFAGRIADTGRDPEPIIQETVNRIKSHPKIELIWASPREILNVWQADRCGCHIITATGDVLKKMALAGKDLNTYSLETVKMFHDDARAAGYSF